jgi:phage baseplate assembly protein V
MITFGVVTQVDPAKAKARVRFPEQDADTTAEEPGMESYWLPVVTQWSTGNKSFCMPIVGEQVVAWMDEEWASGVILGGIYSETDAVPTAPATSRHHVYPDGTVVQYDPATHELLVDVKGTLNAKTTGTATLDAGGVATVKAPSIVLDGPVHITGAVTMDSTLGVTGAASASQFTAGGIALTTHKHLGVTTGGGTSGIPTP